MSNATDGDEDRRRALEQATQAFVDNKQTWPERDRQMLQAAGLVVADLVEQGWQFHVRRDGIEARLSSQVASDVMAEKARVRQQELLKRNEQLRHPAVRSFIKSMEHRRLHGRRFVSIFSLMRDGRELAESLRLARLALTGDTIAPLNAVTAPYLQFVVTGQRCEHTGFLLQDIWRYFRHTWSNQYTSVPGRSMMFLVRDGAVENHPVMGIAALSSPIVQIRERDEWIGWQPTSFLDAARAKPSIRVARWLQAVVDNAIAELYIDDLLADELITRKSLRAPTPDVVAGLLSHSIEERKRHHRFMRSGDYKRAARTTAETSWEERAKTHLFRSKRALALAEFLEARMLIRRHYGQEPSSAGLVALLEDREGVRVAKKIVKRAKSEHVGIAMADITVCGAVPPYNGILGGKLVSMLAASPEVVEAYRHRYEVAVSEIASSMAGRPIVRPPTLVFLGTTSLYGGGSSQYNRIRIPCERLGGEPGTVIEYARLGMSEAFGTSHYSEDTIEALVELVQQSHDGQRVNSIFGEGVSPKLRKVREGLELLNFPSDALLRHGRQRIVYGVTLVRNTRDFLLGIEGTAKYLVPPRLGDRGTQAIADWWKARWLKGRVMSDDVLAEVARHTPVHPIKHGARVVLPHVGPQEELPLGAPS
ncbi:MAG: Druantia anti-phage system protein DruA [Thermoanaerobaculia bacterium]